MKHIFLLLLVLLSFPALALSEKEQEFLERIKEVYTSSNNDALISLYHQDGLTEQHKERIKSIFVPKNPEYRYDLSNIHYPYTEKKIHTKIKDGFKYSPNLEVIGHIRIPYIDHPENGALLPYGQHEGKYFLTAKKREPAPEGTKDDTRFEISIMALEGAEISGSCEYMLYDGISDVLGFEFNETGSKTFRTYAQNIMFCEVINTTGVGTIRLVILSGKDKIFAGNATAPEKTALTYQPD